MFRILKMSFAVIIIILALIAFNYTEHTSVIQSVMLVFLGAVMFMQGLEERKKKMTAQALLIFIPPFCMVCLPYRFYTSYYINLLHILKMLDRRERV